MTEYNRNHRLPNGEPRAHAYGRVAAGTLRKRHQTLPTACVVCGWRAPALPAELSRTRSALLNVHHVVPVCCDGSDDRWNLAVLCPNHHALAHVVSLRRKHYKTGGWCYNGPRTVEDLVADIQRLESGDEGFAEVLSRRLGALMCKTEKRVYNRKVPSLSQPLPQAEF